MIKETSRELRDKFNASSTPQTKDLVIRGQKYTFNVYRIPISNLNYNVKNGRISTWMQSNKELIENKTELEINSLIEDAIYSENKDQMDKTMRDIEENGQMIPGVVLSNGVVIDGNRRFTCIRRLKRFTGKIDSDYFNAVILDEEISKNENDIKRIEYNLQFAAEERKDYNPVDKMYDLYHQVIETKNFTLDEYCAATKMKKSDAETFLEAAIVTKEFLDYIGCDKWDYAKKVNIHGHMDEIAKHLKYFKNKEPNIYEMMKLIMFNMEIVKPKKDVGKYVRNLTNNFKKAKEDSKEKFLQEQEEINEKIKPIINDDSLSYDEKIAKIENYDDEDLATEMYNSVQTLSYVVETQDMNVSKKMDNIFQLLKEVDEDSIPFLPQRDLISLKNTTRCLEDKIERIKNKLNEYEKDSNQH